MKKFKFLPTYKNGDVISGITTFPESKKRSGVYLIKEEGVIVYVGYSTTDLYRTMYRHFQRWNDSRVLRVTYFNKMQRYFYTVRIVYCTPVQAFKLEKMLIVRYQPRDNKERYDKVNITDSFYSVEQSYFDAPVERIVPF
jgi:excinuclease UvrABC nuclease subunit